MNKKIREIDWSLYAIIDKSWSKGRSLEEMAQEAILGGAGVLQLRDKISTSREIYLEAQSLRKIADIPLIINDRLDIALAVEADGVHLGQDDIPVGIARKLAGEAMLIGASVHNLEEAQKAIAEGVDYLGAGAIYPTSTKRDSHIVGVGFIRELRKMTNVPIVAIGGIKVENLRPVILARADGVAVISGLLASEDIRSRARAFLEEIKRVKDNTIHVK